MRGGEAIACLICGKLFRSVGHHVWAAHRISAQDYRDAHGIPRGTKLTAPETRATFARQAMERGLGQDADALRSMASSAGKKGCEVKSDMLAAGHSFTCRRRTPRETIAAVIARASSGERPYQVAREIGLAWSVFHQGLKRHPDLMAQYKALPIRRGRST